MQDYLNRELSVGDAIIYASPHGRNAGASLEKGEVVGFTPQFVRVRDIGSKVPHLVSPRKTLVVNREEEVIQ